MKLFFVFFLSFTAVAHAQFKSMVKTIRTGPPPATESPTPSMSPTPIQTPTYDRSVLFEYKTREKCVPSFGWDGQKNFYLYFYADRTMVILDPKGTLVKQFHLKGPDAATQIAVDQNGDFVCYPAMAAESGSYIFDKDGNYLDSFDGAGLYESAGLTFFNGVIFDEKSGHIYKTSQVDAKVPQKIFLNDVQSLPKQLKVLDFLKTQQILPVPKYEDYSFAGLVQFDFQGNLYIRFVKYLEGDGLFYRPQAFRLCKYDSHLNYLADFESPYNSPLLKVDKASQDLFYLDCDEKTGILKMIRYQYTGAK